MIDRLIEDSNLISLDDYQKNITLIFDEMKIKSDLVYSKGTGKLVGLTDMGDINEEFRSFRDRCEGKLVEEMEFAKYVNVFNDSWHLYEANLPLWLLCLNRLY